MWSSLEHIIQPDNLTEALALKKEPGSVIFTGGSYLVSQKNQNVSTLIDINHLLDDNVETLSAELRVGAACSLQELSRVANPALADAIVYSCPSKNIRNQRTLGGEIAQNRPDSDLLVYLHAAEAKLQINESGDLIHIADWNRNGIISMIYIPQNNTTLERVSVLDSAIAYVIVAVHQTPEYIILSIGGRSTKIIYYKAPLLPEETQIRKFMEKIESIFVDDHFGSPAYKRQIASNLLTEMMVTS
ncbi:MAG: FAD binding domain-containing protein [Candidatus Marinimicrobia bacterium]|nr:FAD binding domain-containing protein [Candidatus Neomarinimicrobiota bacterium]